MRAWIARILAVAFAGAAIYLTVTSAHTAASALEAALAAAVLSVLTVALLWRVPVAAAILNACWIVAAIVVGTWFATAQNNAVAQTGAVLPAPSSANGSEVVSAVAKLVGNDPAAVLASIRDGVRYEIYPGVFRGPVATIADGAGDDYDRALLLHDLLLAANPSQAVRYAFCTLSAQQSDAAIAAARSAYRAPAIGTNAQTLATNAPPQMRDGFSRIAAFWRSALAQERQQTTELAVDFQKAGAQLTSPADPGLRLIAADHVWIQVQRQGNWVDLDPAVPNATPGASLCAAAKTSDALPDGSYDTVTATLDLETRSDARENAAVIASGTWRTADLAQTPLIFAFAEPSGLHAPAPQPTGMRSYTPLLVAGSQTIVAAPITVPTPLVISVVKAGSKIASQGGSQAVAAFGSSPPAAATAAPTPSGPIPVALRLSVSVAAPNTATVTVDHTVFDRLSAPDRAAGRADTATLAPVSSLLPFGTVLNVGVNLGTGVAGVGDYTPFDPRSDDPANTNRALGAMHRAYYGLRRAVFADSLGPSAPPVVAIRPSVSFLGFAPFAAGPIDFGLTIDRAAEGAAPDGGDANSSLAWGVASLYGERLAVSADRMMASSDKLDELPFDDSIEMFYIARYSNDAPALVRSSSDVASLKVSDDTKTRLGASMANGSRAVVPSEQVGYGGSSDNGWWTLGPDGSVSDEMQSGTHPEEIEEAPAVEEAAEEAPQEAREGGAARCVAWAAQAVLGVGMAIGAAHGGEGASETAEQLAELIHSMYEEDEVEEIIETANQCSWGSSDWSGAGGPPPGGKNPWYMPVLGPGHGLGGFRWPIIPK